MIREVWQNLGIAHFEYRTAEDADVRPYVHDVGFTTETVSVPAEVQGLAIAIGSALRHQEKVLVDMHLLRENVASKRELLDLGTQLHREIALARARGQAARPTLAGRHPPRRGDEGPGRARTGGNAGRSSAVRQFLERQSNGRPSPAERAFLGDPEIQTVRETLATLNMEHPKLAAATRAVREELARSPGSRVIVFAQDR